MNSYSDLKAAWHIDKLATLRRGGQIVPSQVQLIISDLCNHDCGFCSYRISNGFSAEQFADDAGNRNPNRMIPVEKVEEILTDCAILDVRAVQFTGGGEPTVHPHHMRIFRYAHHLGLETALVTNGGLLRDGWRDVFPRMTWLRVSVDAADADQYAAIRRVGKSAYHVTLNNMQAIAGQLRDSKSPCLFGAGYVVTRDNFRGLADGIRRIRDTGVAYVRLSAMFSKDFVEYYRAVDPLIRDEIARSKQLETPTFKVLDLYSNRIEDLRQASPDYKFCGYQQFNTYIGGNLKVYRCCNTAYTLHGEVGDLREQSFIEWFTSQPKKSAYACFDARSCAVCQFNGKNWAINYLLDPSPEHIHFV